MATRRPLTLVGGTIAELPAGDDLAGSFFDIAFVFDGDGSVIPTGPKADLAFDFAFTIAAWTLLGDQAGSIVVDLWKDSYANYPPTAADTITASAKPTLSSAAKAQSATLTGWTTAVAGGETIRANVDSASTITRATLILKCQRS